MKIVSIIAAILLLTGCPNPADIDPGPSLPTGLDSPDTSGNLYVVNQIADTPVLLYTEDGGTLELKKRIPSTGEAFLVDIPNPSGFAKTLKLWKQGDEGPLENPSEENLYRRWDVVLSTDSDPSNRATWIITDRTSGGSASGTLLFSYSDTGADELKNIYSADVFLNNKDGAKITALSPGTANKKVGVEYGYYPIYYRYWYDDPNDSAGAEEVGWVEENSAGEAIYVLLNGANTEISIDAPVYYAAVGKSGTVDIENASGQVVQIYADSNLIETLHQGTGPTDALSILADGSSYTFRLPAGQYNLEARSPSGSGVLDSFSDLDISEKHEASWIISSSPSEKTIEIVNELSQAMSIHDDASGTYLGYTIEPGQTRTVVIPSRVTALKALNRFATLGAQFSGSGGQWTISADNAVWSGSIANLIPANGAAVAETTPTLRWDAVGDAVRYELQIAGSAAELSGETAVSAATASYTFSEALANGQTRYWRVRAIGANGLLGPWSSSSSFMVRWGIMTGLSPADGASTTDTTPTLSWDTVPRAEGYELQTAESQVGVETAPIQSITGASYTPPSALTNEKTHYWRVRGVDGDGQKGAWSVVHSLKVEWGAVSSLSPADGSTTEDTTPTLSWTAVPGAAGYEVRIADSPAGLNSASSVSETNPSHTPASALTNSQTHYWQVRAKDGDGQYGNWSEIISVFVGNWTVGWVGTDSSVRMENNQIYIDSDGSYDDGMELFLNEAFPLTVETRMRLVSGGRGYLTPWISFYYGNDEDDRIILVSGSKWTFGAYSSGWPNWQGSTIKTPSSENVWVTCKVVLRQNGGDLYVKHDEDDNFILAKSSQWSVADRLIKIHISQPWDAICHIDYVKIDH